MNDFTKLLEQLAKTLASANEQIEEMNRRFRAFGEHLAEANRKLNGQEPGPTKPTSMEDRLRVMRGQDEGKANPV